MAVSNLAHLPRLLIHVNLHDINIYFRFSHHQWDLLLHSTVLITYQRKQFFYMELEGRRGRGIREQREEGKGGGRPQSIKTAFYFKDLCVCVCVLQQADKNGVKLWTFFFFLFF